MAISHVQPLFLLLASFFFLPAYCGVSFKDCVWTTTQGDVKSTLLQASPATVTSADMIPEIETREDSIPVITVTRVDIARIQGLFTSGFNISATTTKSLTEGYVRLEIFSGVRQLIIATYPLCEHMSCNLPAGPFVLSFVRILSLNIWEPFTAKVYIFDYAIFKCVTFEYKFEQLVAPILSAQLML